MERLPESKYKPKISFCNNSLHQGKGIWTGEISWSNAGERRLDTVYGDNPAEVGKALLSKADEEIQKANRDYAERVAEWEAFKEITRKMMANLNIEISGEDECQPVDKKMTYEQRDETIREIIDLARSLEDAPGMSPGGCKMNKICSMIRRNIKDENGVQKLAGNKRLLNIKLEYLVAPAYRAPESGPDVISEDEVWSDE